MALTTVHRGRLEYLVSLAIVPPHGFTTRYGGVSQGHLASLNLGFHRGDWENNVLENYRILTRELGCTPEDVVTTKQVHGNTVLAVDATNRGEGVLRPQETPCDALVTATPGVALTVFTADCTPILLWDPVTGAVGAAHAGWRSTALDIAGETVKAMVTHFGSRPADIRAAIGPNIGKCCFETDSDVPQAMEAVLGDGAAPYIQPTGEKFHVDLKGINAALLRRAGVEHIDISTECTACDPGRFWSARVVGSSRGSQGAIILCKGAMG